jgi:hypothetical protein
MAWAVAIGAMGGCGQGDVPAGDASPSPAAASAELQPASDGAATASPTGPAEGSAQADTDAAAAQPPSTATYEAPFPERLELFAPPKRVVSEGPAGNTSEESVTLLGFIHVDRERAILDFNGQSLPVAEGETHFGVEIVSIRPPAVVLQRGRERWQTSLSD